MRACRATRDADDGSARVRIPPRTSESGEGRNHEQSAAVGHARGQWTDLLGARDDSEAVAQPLDGRARHEDGSFECVGGREASGAVGKSPRHGREESVARCRAGRADVHEDETAGAVGVLGHTGGEAGLAEERTLLITGDSRDRYSGGEFGAGGGADASARRHHGGESPTRNTDQFAELVAPRQLGDVEEHRATRVGRISGVNGTGGEAVHDPCIDRAEAKVVVGRHPVFDEPGHLGAREVRIEDETGVAPNEVEVWCELLAALGRPSVLPHDRPSEGERGSRAPGDDCLALIRDADSGGEASSFDDFSKGGHDRGPDLERIVLDPTGFGEVLGELAVGGDARTAIGEDGP